MLSIEFPDLELVKNKDENLVEYESIPKELVDRLKLLIDKYGEDKFLKKMNIFEVADDRFGIIFNNREFSDTENPGGRVRMLKNIKEASGRKIIIKRIHEDDWAQTAQETLDVLKARVSYMQDKIPKDTRLVENPGVAIGENIIVMPYINAPTIDQMTLSIDEKIMPERKKRFIKILEQNGISIEHFEKTARTHIDIGTRPDNILFLGVDDDKKMVFLPLADLS